MRGSAMSGAPTCIGIIQLARPTNAGMIAPKIMTSACMVVMVLNSAGSRNCSAGLEQLGADQHREGAADEEHDAAEHQVQRADVLVIGGRHPALPEAVRLVVVIVVRGCAACSVWAMSYSLSPYSLKCLLMRMRRRGCSSRQPCGGSRRRARCARSGSARIRRGAAQRLARRRRGLLLLRPASAPAASLSKSALLTTSTTMGMKPWSRPQSSAHWPR